MAATLCKGEGMWRSMEATSKDWPGRLKFAEGNHAAAVPRDEVKSRYRLFPARRGSSSSLIRPSGPIDASRRVLSNAAWQQDRAGTVSAIALTGTLH
jgi:hypothetical protein